MSPISLTLKFPTGSFNFTTRLAAIWPRAEAAIYAPLYEQCFPVIDTFAQLLVDPEFGPLIFRHWHNGLASLVLIVEERKFQGQMWCLAVDNASLRTHGRISEPHWLPLSFFRHLARVARNVLFVECGFV